VIGTPVELLTTSKKPTFHYTRRITPKRVTRLRCQGNTATCVDVEAVANRLQR